MSINYLTRDELKVDPYDGNQPITIVYKCIYERPLFTHYVNGHLVFNAPQDRQLSFEEQILIADKIARESNHE